MPTSTEISSLITQLTGSKLASTNYPNYLAIKGLIDNLNKVVADLDALTARVTKLENP